MSTTETSQESFFRREILGRFLRYAAITTTSDRHAQGTPTTACQWDLIRLLERELGELGVDELTVNNEGFILARLASNLPAGASVPCLGFMAHVDTASDVSGENVKPQVHEQYDGGVLELSPGVRLSPEDSPQLLDYRGETVITSDGTTLLGADDKAGVAEIMAALAWLKAHPEIPHGRLELVFTPDEETGKGMDRFPRESLKSEVCYTLDGDGEGTVEAECFNAYKVEVTCTGKVIHIGHARGKLVNAISMAAAFLNLVPRPESPEATDGRYGYYCPLEIKGTLESAWLEFYLRDFETKEIDRRIEAMKAFGRAVEAAFPGGAVSVKAEKQYLNMREAFGKRPEIVAYLDEAIRQTGIEPRHASIRGGTDGARLSEIGIPTPNVFAGGFNFHSRTEWVPLPAMVRAAKVIINLVKIWAGHRDRSA